MDGAAGDMCLVSHAAFDAAELCVPRLMWKTDRLTFSHSRGSVSANRLISASTKQNQCSSCGKRTAEPSFGAATCSYGTPSATALAMMALSSWAGPASPASAAPIGERSRMKQQEDDPKRLFETARLSPASEAISPNVPAAGSQGLYRFGESGRLQRDRPEDGPDLEIAARIDIPLATFTAGVPLELKLSSHSPEF